MLYINRKEFYRWICSCKCYQVRTSIYPVWSESSLCAQWVAKDPRFLHADSEDSDQTERMPRLIRVFALRRLILLSLSCRGSHNKFGSHNGSLTQAMHHSVDTKHK